MRVTIIESGISDNSGATDNSGPLTIAAPHHWQDWYHSTQGVGVTGKDRARDCFMWHPRNKMYYNAHSVETESTPSYVYSSKFVNFKSDD